MSSAIELVLIFVALEISSISTYVLAGLRRREASSSEASLKYFLLGSFATAFFLYGVALMFGATGSTNIDAISQVLRSGNVPVLAYLATALMFVGLGFKVASAPFHIWTPDVYEGARSGRRADVDRPCWAAAFVVLLRVMFEANAPDASGYLVARPSSMTLGNVGPGAGQRQAPARVFVDRPRRLSAGRVCGTAGTGHVRGDVLYRRLCRDAT
jgi:NADH-quinone oxidoreductase subunit N